MIILIGDQDRVAVRVRAVRTRTWVRIPLLTDKRTLGDPPPPPPPHRRWPNSPTGREWKTSKMIA